MFGIYLKSSKNLEFTLTTKAVYSTFATKEEAIAERDKIEQSLRDAFKENSIDAPISFMGLGVCEMTDGTSIIPLT